MSITTAKIQVLPAVSDNTTFYLTGQPINSGLTSNQYVLSGLTFNPSSNILTANTVIANNISLANVIITGTTLLNSGLVPGELIYRLETPYTGLNASTVQPVFGVGVTVAASTVYQFDGIYIFARATGSTSHTLSIGFGGTATLNNIGYFAQEGDNPTSFTTNMSNSQPNQYAFVSAAQTVVMGARTTALDMYVIVKGTVSINAGGTFIPQYQLSAAPGAAYATYTGSYFKLSPIGTAGANTSIGTWA
jgi:hypothetical protein